MGRRRIGGGEVYVIRARSLVGLCCYWKRGGKREERNE